MNCSLQLASPPLWSPASPALLIATLSVASPSAADPLDIRTVRFGVRDVRARGCIWLGVRLELS